uniref:KPRO n=1 Tax=Arundo donax TaxID=35708 RepID=A0A0A9E7L2_ARUDO
MTAQTLISGAVTVMYLDTEIKIVFPGQIQSAMGFNLLQVSFCTMIVKYTAVFHSQSKSDFGNIIVQEKSMRRVTHLGQINKTVCRAQN